jgi:hypothetical protein
MTSKKAHLKSKGRGIYKNIKEKKKKEKRMYTAVLRVMTLN